MLALARKNGPAQSNFIDRTQRVKIILCYQLNSPNITLQCPKRPHGTLPHGKDIPSSP